jgi:undecaprenyl-diphosphatase
MMVWMFAVLLGVVQGLTEFLPVSSSGHLVMFQQILGEEQLGIGDHVAFDLVLHLGTLVPVLIMYRSDIFGMFSDLRGDGPPLERGGLRLAAWVLVGTVPTGLIGILLKDVFEQLFTTTLSVGVAFAVTAALLWRTRAIEHGGREIAGMTWKDALIIGLAQGFAITPGISRSGTTIAVALMLGIRRDLAARYSFLLSVPAILGAFVLKAKDVDVATAQAVGPLVIGFVAAALSGWVALVILLRLVRTGDFSRFSYYLAPLSVIAVGYGLFGPGGFF